EQSAHYYEIDFLVPCNSKLVAIEVKSSRIDNHSSIDAFLVKFSNQVKEGLLVSQKEYQKIGNITNYPFYLLQHKLNELQAN
ncbi:MAG: ATPase, partial [Succinivibrio sp.]|nr:ATPase [Succinivibrio sp.]